MTLPKWCSFLLLLFLVLFLYYWCSGCSWLDSRLLSLLFLNRQQVSFSWWILLLFGNMDQYSFFLPYLSQNKNIKNLKEEVMRKRRWLFTAFFCCFAALLCCLTSRSKAKAEDSYTVTYHANGGTFEDGSVTYGPPVEKKLPKLSRQTMSVMMAVLIPMDTVTTKRLQTK